MAKGMNDQQSAILDFVHNGNNGSGVVFDGRTIASCWTRGWLNTVDAKVIVTVKGYAALADYCTSNAKAFERQKSAWAKAGYETESTQWQVDKWNELAEGWKAEANKKLVLK